MKSSKVKFFISIMLMLNSPLLYGESCKNYERKSTSLIQQAKNAFMINERHTLLLKANNFQSKANACRLKKIMSNLGLKDN